MQLGFLFCLQNGDFVCQNFRFAGGKQNGMMLVGKLAGLIFKGTAAVPGLHADVRRVFAYCRPERDHRKVGKIHLNALSVGTEKLDRLR